jgi:FliI/YscN family ATPase
VVEIERHAGGRLEAEVIGFRDELTLLAPLGPIDGVYRGSPVRLARTRRWLHVGNELLGRVIDAHGQAIDGRPLPGLSHRMALEGRPPPPLDRPPIVEPLSTGIRAIDGLLTVGKGQRVGIFSAAGVGKSVTLGMMARYSAADVIVVALIGERGREVNEFLERDLGPEGRPRSVVVVATSDEPALRRVRAGLAATAVAEHFRDQGRDVLLVMDSLTRLALAQRELGLAAGEPPATRGFPPSVFALLPKLVERAGRGPRGSITAFYSVLVEGDDPDEPISDAVRGLLDGHTLLSRRLAGEGHYPAIDVVSSLSRLMPAVATPAQLDAATTVRELLSAYREHEDLISIGAYRRGSQPTVDVAIEMRDEIQRYLRQKIDERSSVATARDALVDLAKRCALKRQAAAAGPATAQRSGTATA